MKFTDIFEYIENNLEEKLTICDVANFANYSPYHFQRMLAGAVGVSLGSYIRRRRLTKAALQLINSSDRLIEVALGAGFGSQESFSRSFKSMFGTTPKDYRINHDFSIVRSMDKLNLEFLQHIKNDIVNLAPEFIEKDAFTVIGMKKTFLPTDSQIPALWNNFNSRTKEIPDVKNKEAFSICEEIWKDGIIQEDFNYIAAIPVNEDSIPPKDMEKISIPKTKYAVFYTQRFIEYLWTND